MTEPDRKFEEEIRRALCAASDLIVPAGDGLNLIRERAARRPPALRWLLACAAHLPRQLVRASTVAASEVAATTRGYSSLGLVLASARRWPGKAHRGLRTPSLWLRPVLATATALLLVIAVTLSIPRLRQTVGAQLDSAFGSSSGQGPNGGPGGAVPGGVAQSTGATPMTSGTDRIVAGLPFLATMPPPGAQCRAHGTGETAAASYVPPSLGPAVSQTAGSGTNAGVTTPATCHSSTAPAKANRATSLSSPPVTTTVPTSPPPTTTVPTSPPPTTTVPTSPPPTTTVPTSPPPTTTTPTTPPTSPDSSTSSADSTASTGAATETPDPAG